MKKRMLAALLLSALLFTLSGCGEKSLLNKKEPVSLTFWHVYGEQAGSPMDLLVQEFNRTVGQERGVQVKVTGTSSASKIGGYLKEAQSGGQEGQEMPDLFTCHIIDALELGEDNLVPWNEQFTPDELSDFIPGFLSDGTAEDGRLLIFPVSKSTQLLMCNGSGFDRFSAATGVGYEDLATWEGFYDAAGRFYDWSGKPFCALDYPIRAVELCAMERGSGDFYTGNGWYDTNNAIFKESWMQFARSLAQGHVVVSDLYSNTQVMTGDVVCGLGSSAAILYYNDTVTYPDGHVESIHHSFANIGYAEQAEMEAISASLPDAIDAPNPGDTLRASMSPESYAELMEATDAELPSIADTYASADFSGALPEPDTASGDPECSADADSRTDSAAEPDAAAEAEADADPDPD